MSETITGRKTEGREESLKKKYRTRNLLLAAFYNLIMPGLGYFYIGKFRFAIYFSLIYPILFVFVNYISIHLSEGLNSIFFIICNAVLISVPVIHVVYTSIKNQLNKFYVLKKFNKTYLYIIFFVAGFLYTSYIKDFTFELHSITTSSMENTLMIGDRILVRYNYYGVYESIFEKRLFNFHSPERNEIVVYSTMGRQRRVVYLKRLVAIPRDTLTIVDKKLYINETPEVQNKTYKYDGTKIPKDYVNNKLYPVGSKWNEDYYGPLYIPAKGDCIKIDSSNVKFLTPIIKKELRDEGDADAKEKRVEAIIKSGEYIVQNNYYFMMGDDRDNSLDSRYTGLVSEEEILGRAEFVVFNIYEWGRLGISLR
ncbi:MAG: signal peptidase I [Bacteroidetes bacterium]|nr:signal peptidase I [Bacteroidota bacterium]